MPNPHRDIDIDERELTRIAARHGMTAREAYLAWQRGIAAIEDDGIEYYHPSDDPLHDFLGSQEAGVPDLAERHDDYLGETYRDAKDGSA